MKWPLRLAAVTLIAALIAVLFYTVVKYVLPVWAPILYYSYLLVGLIVNSFGLFTIFRKLKESASIKDDIVRSVTKARAVANWFTRLRELLTSMFIITHGILIWPPDSINGIIVKNETPFQDFIISIQLKPMDHIYSGFALSTVLISLGLDFVGIHSGIYGRAFIITIGASVILRHLRYAVESEGLPIRLRRLAANPYATFLAIVVFDFSTLVLALTMLSPGLPPADIDLNDLKVTAFGLLRFRDLENLFYGIRLSGVQIITASAGLIFYLAITKTLLRYKDFSRTDPDYAWLATHNMRLGKFSTAIMLLKNIKVRTRDTELLYVAALIGVSSFDEAIEKLQAILKNYYERTDSTQLCRILFDICIPFPFHERIVSEVLKRVVGMQISDSLLQDIVTVLVADSDRLTAEAKGLLNGLEARYPLTRASLAIVERDFAEARTLLKTATPGTELEEIIRLVMLLRASLADPATSEEEDQIAFRQWAETALPAIRGMLTGLSEPLDRAMAFAQLAVVRFLASMLVKDREQEIEFMCHTLKDKIKDDPETNIAVKAVEIRIANLAKRAAAA